MALRDLQDYRVAAGSGPVPSSPGSPFNIIEDSLRIMDFTRDEVAALYRQHTEETGQEFTPEAVDRAYDYTQGQPWLVNALAYEITARMRIDLPDPITAESPARFVLPDGRLDFPALLDAFADFWLENGEFMTANETYHEAAAQLVFMGFLQRIVNGGGFIDREYAVGSGRTDILIRKPYGHHQMQREAIELKAWALGKADPLKAGLRQLDGYLDRFRLDTGTLIIFDRRPAAPSITDRTRLSKETTPSGRVITLLRA